MDPPIDPEQLENVRANDNLPELPLGTSTAAAYADAAIHNVITDLSHPQAESSDHNETRSARHVDIGHFDPSGVNELRRAMSRASGVSSGRRADAQSVSRQPTRSDATSDEGTLTPGDGPFDFEKTLKTVMRRYAFQARKRTMSLTLAQAGAVRHQDQRTWSLV